MLKENYDVIVRSIMLKIKMLIVTQISM